MTESSWYKRILPNPVAPLKKEEPTSFVGRKSALVRGQRTGLSLTQGTSIGLVAEVQPARCASRIPVVSLLEKCGVRSHLEKVLELAVIAYNLGKLSWDWTGKGGQGRMRARTRKKPPEQLRRKKDRVDEVCPVRARVVRPRSRSVVTHAPTRAGLSNEEVG